MTRKVATLWCIGLLIGSALSAEAQVTPNYWPAFPYDPEIALGMKSLPPFRKFKGYAKYIPNRIPDEVWKQKVSKERILGPDGVEMIPLAPYNADQTETWIAVDPNNPNNIIASSNDSRLNGQGGKYYMPAYYSNDGGQTWQESKTPENPFITTNTAQGIRATIFDPGLFFDTKGRAYLAFGMTQSIDGDYDEGDNGVFVAYSDDQGKTWQYGEPVSLQNNGTSNQPFEDKYLATADVGANSPYKDNLYVVWTRFKQDRGIYFARSTDRGGSWQGPTLLPGGNIGSYQSPVPAVGPEGNVYVAWRRENGDNTQAIVQVSKNGGQNWQSGNGVVAQSVRTSGTTNSATGRNELRDKQSLRISSYPAMAVDNSNGAHRGRVYVIQSGKEANGKPGIFMTYSDNAGQSWSQSKRIDGNKAGNDVFLPAVAVDPLTGTLGVLYYSSENSTDNKGVDAYFAVSSDGGATFNYVRLTAYTFYINDAGDVSNQGSSFYWGDYTSMAAQNGKFFPCYWAPNAPNGGYFTLDLYTNILSKAPRPVSNQTAQNSIAAPNILTLTWSDPTSNLFGQALSAFKVVIYRRVKGESSYQKIGEVNGGAQTYTDNTVTDGVEYEYQFVVVADDMESTAQTASAVAGGALQPMAPVIRVARPHENGVEVEFESPEFHVDNTPFNDYHEVALYSGTDKLASVPVASSGIQAGEINRVVFSVPVKQFYNLSLKAVGKRGDKLTESDASAAILAYAGSPLTTLMADFDSQDSVAYYTGPDDRWGRTGEAAHSGEFSFTDSPGAKYKGLKDYELILAPVVVAASTPSLSFEHIALVDPGDNAELLLSNDFGVTWRWVRTYNRNSASGFGSTVQNSQWDTESVSVAEYTGDTLYIRFALRTTAVTHDDGWYIDDVRLDNLPVDVRGADVAPTAYLGKAYPNPASGNVQVEYKLQQSTMVKIELYNTIGEVAAVLADGFREAGIHTLPFSVDNVPAGLYFYRLTLGDGTVLVRPLSVNH